MGVCNYNDTSWETSDFLIGLQRFCKDSGVAADAGQTVWFLLSDVACSLAVSRYNEFSTVLNFIP